MKTTKIVLYIAGGTLQGVRTNAPLKRLNVVLVDEDNLRAEGKSWEQINNVWKRRTKGCDNYVL